MTVVGLHPEELFDKLSHDELTPVERQRLRQHLDGCEVCRFEYAARLDFQAEAMALPAGPPPLLPLRAQHAARPARRWSRALVWGVAAALLISASGAVASVVVGQTPWHLVSRGGAARGTPAQPAPATPTAAAVAAKSQPVAPTAAERVPAAQVAERGVARELTHKSRPHAATLAVSLPPAGAEAVAKQPASKEPSTAAQLFGEANQARRAGDIGRASGLYHALQDQFPGSPEAELSRVTLALLLLDSGDAQSALTGFERYLAGPSRGLEAEALVGRARALGRLGRRDLEKLAWQEVQRKYPRSIYGRQATERLSALGLP